jgi:hypothetical protein
VTIASKRGYTTGKFSGDVNCVLIDRYCDELEIIEIPLQVLALFLSLAQEAEGVEERSAKNPETRKER